MKLALQIASLLTLAIALGGCRSREYNKDDGSETETFAEGMTTIKGGALGLGRMELALTLDDGPSAYTVGLAKWLQKRGVPAVFFMNYNNGSNGVGQRPRELAAMCAMNYHILANHSDNHNTRQRPWSELDDTHKALRGNADCKASHPFFFFRAPGGNWVANNATDLNGQRDNLGDKVGELYIGPVYWDIDGEDWGPECRNSPSTCRTKYLNLIKAGTSGRIVLAHDIHKSTITMLMGSNWEALLENPNARDPGDGLIAQAEAAGYKWVRLDKNHEKVKALLGRDPGTTGRVIVPARISCPDGFIWKSIGESGGQYCLSTDGGKVYGPFTEAMKKKCMEWQGGPACNNDNWAAQLALDARGKGVCPLGAVLDETGYCVEGANAFGPFSPALIEKCRAADGGSACNSARWSKTFLKSLLN